PYNYYPYGQIGSRLYQSYSLFPDDVTEIIKFRVWDIPDVSPTREQRYERLRQISKLASDLGLPNIYTMAQRYEAEDRWQLLQPLAIQVYGGTNAFRKPPRFFSEPLGMVFDRYSDQPGSNSVLCYDVSISKEIDAEVLSAAVKE